MSSRVPLIVVCLAIGAVAGAAGAHFFLRDSSPLRSGQTTTAAMNGLVIIETTRSVTETLDRVEDVLAQNGVTVFARIDHGAGAASIGQDLPPAQLLIFGNPNIGTPLIADTSTIGIDLPLKLLAWQDRDGKNWLAYYDPAILTARHGITGQDLIVGRITGALSRLTAQAAEQIE